jgi:predicted nucleotidyltransferase
MSFRDQVVAEIEAIKEQIAALGVTELRLFGSVARGEDHPGSDVDILVQFDGPATFDGYMDLKFLLEDRLGRSVGLVTFAGLREEIRSEVLGEALRVG